MLIPKLFEILPKLTKKQLMNDIIAGILVGIVALPLGIAFGIASGVTPEKGLITAVIGGFLVSFLGGSHVQIGGPTGAFIIIIYGIVEQFGVDGLMVATMMAGIFLIIMGLSKFGSLIKFIPYPVVVGFTSGIAVVIFSTQIKDFFGLTIDKVPGDFVSKWGSYFTNFESLNWQAMLIGLLSLLIIIFWPRVNRKIPGSIIAILVSTLLVSLLNLNVPTIESHFGSIPSSLPKPQLPNISFELIKNMISPAFTIAMLAAIEALLSAVVADGMIGEKHKSNTELIGQGVANIVSPLFGGIPVTGAIARTATNIKNGGRTPIAGIVHAITLLLIMLLLGPWAKLIPMSTLAAILIMVAYNMSEHHIFRQLLKSPKSDVIVLLTTFLLTVFFDLTIAIEVGLVLAMFLFMKRMATVSNIDFITNSFQDKADEDDPNSIKMKDVPKGVEVYEVGGPFFFGAASKFKDSIRMLESPPKIRIIRMRDVPAIDATGLSSLRNLYLDSKHDGIILLLSGVNTQPLKALKNFGLYDLIGDKNIHQDIDSTLERAKELIKPK
ncbi:sulfate permease [bacterium]|nr:sulfate permease [bacterium]